MKKLILFSALVTGTMFMGGCSLNFTQPAVQAPAVQAPAVQAPTVTTPSVSIK